MATLKCQYRLRTSRELLKILVSQFLFTNCFIDDLSLIDFESDEEEEVEDTGDKKDWDRFDSVLRDITSIPVCGYKVSFLFVSDFKGKVSLDWLLC